MSQVTANIICFPDVRYSEQFVKHASSMGARILLVGEQSWLIKTDPRGDFPQLPVSTHNHERTTLEALKKEVSELWGSDSNVSIVSFSERNVGLTAYLNDSLGGKGNSSNTAHLLRNKLAMKEAAFAAGIAVPKFAPVGDLSRLRDVVRSQKPLIVKPIDGWASQGIKLVKTPQDLSSIPSDGPFLVEEFIDGDVYHVDGVVNKGNVIRKMVGRYGRPLLGIGEKKGNNFQDFIIPCNSLIADRLKEQHDKVVKALSIEWGATHIEFFVERQTSQILLCEAAGRLPGNGITRLHEMASGVNTFKTLAEIYCGVKQKIQNPLKRCAGLLCINPYSGRLVAADDAEKYRFWRNVVETESVAKIGDSIQSSGYLSELARFYLISESFEECKSSLEKIESHYFYEIEVSQ